MADPVPRQDVTYYEAWRDDLPIETVWHEDGREFLCVIAPHGGDIEAGTDTMAVEMYKKMPEGSASLWMFQSFDSTPVGEHTAFERHHVTSTEITAERFPALAEIDDVGFRYCVSFHVKGNAEAFEVGGLAADELREDVAGIVADAAEGTWPAVTDHDEGTYMAVSEANITNRLTHDSSSGIQIEMPGDAVRNYGRSIAEGLAEYFAGRYEDG